MVIVTQACLGSKVAAKKPKDFKKGMHDFTLVSKKTNCSFERSVLFSEFTHHHHHLYHHLLEKMKENFFERLDDQRLAS